MRPRTIAIGDIHGCSLALEALLAAIEPRPDDVIVTLGDYVNRGPDSRGVLDRLIELERQCTLVPILGNHDQTLLAALAGERRALCPTCWTWEAAPRSRPTAPGRITEADLARIPPEHLAFLERCRDYYETETHIFVHAQYDPDLPWTSSPRVAACAGNRSATASPARTSRASGRSSATPRRRAARSSTWATWSASTRSATAAAG